MNFLMTIFETINTLPLPMFATLAGIMGLLIGSFLNVVIVRLPIMMQREEALFFWHYQQEQNAKHAPLHLSISTPSTAINHLPEVPEHLNAKYSLYIPASHCPQCKAPVKWWMNIPVISYIGLKGRCYSCDLSISIQYPIVEITAALLGVAAAIFWGDTLGRGTACAMMVFLWSLLTLTVIDFKTQYLPDIIVLPLLWLGLMINTVDTLVSLSSAVWGAVAGYMSLFSVCYVFKLLTGKQGMGHGDFKLLAALGAWLGVKMLLPIILLSSVFGSLVGILLMLNRQMKQGSYIAFGPYLAIAGVLCAFYGSTMIEAYLSYMTVA
jgi:leader peptidase (prepilin peptidase) / N-methyltransferase